VVYGFLLLEKKGDGLWVCQLKKCGGWGGTKVKNESGTHHILENCTTAYVPAVNEQVVTFRKRET